MHAFEKLVEGLCALPVGGVVITHALLSAPMIRQLRFDSSKIVTEFKRNKFLYTIFIRIEAAPRLVAALE